MFIQSGVRAEPLVALVTAIWFIAGVSFLVHDEVVGLDESFVANIADERGLPAVQSFVVSEIVASDESLLAQVAGVGLLAGVRELVRFKVTRSTV